ncbi:unnamed protein product [Urochloa decumbens]|uniref:Uncharacterized protein n=1 Tax=Urochloa decumbens TaxID=240449 RepID=A0ABC9A077_9POAL
MESTVMTTFSLKPGQCHGSCHLPIALSQPIGKCSRRPRICQRRKQYAVLRCQRTHQQPAGTLHDDHDEIDDDRPNKNPARFHPSIWGDFFLHYSNPIASFPEQQVRMAERAGILKKQVEQMMERSSSCSLLQRLHLIHVLQRLCLDHLFEAEINDLFTQIKNADVSGCDLHTVALWFYLLRNHGFRVSPDEDGSFKTNCSEDLLILYNAGYFGTHGETILDEAVSFSKKCLETTMPHLDPEGSLAREITCALETPLPRRVRIYELKHYISIFEKETTVHETILELAKVNSNLMQLHFQRELKIITRSWDPKVGKELPENLKIILERILATYKDIEHELETEHKYRMSYLKFVTIDWVRAYTTEVKWRDQRYVPATVEEHLELSVRSGACHLLSCASFVGMDEVATREPFEWVSSMPKIVHSLCVILRLLDDPKSYEREQRALHVASTIDSCMKEHNVSMELALKKIKEMTEDSWKSLNEEWLKTDKAQTKELLDRIFNLARTMEFFYKQEDAYTNSYIIKDTIKSLFVDSY